MRATRRIFGPDAGELNSGKGSAGLRGYNLADQQIKIRVIEVRG